MTQLKWSISATQLCIALICLNASDVIANPLASTLSPSLVSDPVSIPVLRQQVDITSATLGAGHHSNSNGMTDAETYQIGGFTLPVDDALKSKRSTQQQLNLTRYRQDQQHWASVSATQGRHANGSESQLLGIGAGTHFGGDSLHLSHLTGLYQMSDNTDNETTAYVIGGALGGGSRITGIP